MADATDPSEPPQPTGPIVPAAERRAAAAVQRLGAALLGHTITPELSERVATELERLVDQVERTGDPRTKADAFERYSGPHRIEHFRRTGQWPAAAADGGEFSFDVLSFVGGRLNPIASGARFWRDGDESVASMTFGPTYEGPPTRVHGGMLAAAFDEVMGALFVALGMPPAFTGTLSVRYQAGAPLGEPIEFRARLGGVDGRKTTVLAEATASGTTLATAEAVFIQIPMEMFEAMNGSGEAEAADS
ncbi:MAG: PaaI family thioesterase [Actinomycetota bacterium]